jgi:hypothetical protein
MKLAFDWHKVSYRRYSAEVGQLRIEIRRSRDDRWFVGEIFGNAFLDPLRESYATPEEAMARAERLAGVCLTDLITSWDAAHERTP